MPGIICLLREAEWEEDVHPRDERGRFSPSNGSGVADIKARMSEGVDRIASGPSKAKDVGPGKVATRHTQKIMDNVASEMSRFEKYLAPDANARMHDIRSVLGAAIVKAIPEMRDANAKALNDLAVESVRRIAFQEAESAKQQFTDHGVRHIEGNLSRQQSILDAFEAAGHKVSGRDRLLAVFAMVNHDLGYAHADVVKGGLGGVKASGKHPETSALIAESERSRWDEGKLFSGKEWDGAVRAISSHASTELDKNDLVATSTRLADNLSLFASEKLPSAFKYVPGGDAALVRMGKAALAGDSKTFAAEKKALGNALQKADLDPRLKRDLAAGLSQVTEMTPKFTMGVLAGEMIGVSPSKKAGAVIDITVMHNKRDAMLQKVFDMGQAKVRGFLKDNGVKDFSKCEHVLGGVVRLRVTGGQCK